MLVKTVDILFKIPAIRQRCWSWLDGEVEKMKRECALEDPDLWPDSVTTVGKVRVNWMANWMRTQWPDHFTKDLLERVNQAHKYNILRIFSLITMMFKTNGVPAELQDAPDVYARFCALRANLVGMDVPSFVAKKISKSDGKVNYTGYPWEFTWDDAQEKIVRVTSYLGDSAELEAHNAITKMFKIENHNCLLQAKAKYKQTTHVILDCLPEGSRTRTLLMDKKCANVAEMVKEAKATHARAVAERAKVGDGKIKLRSAVSAEEKKRKMEKILAASAKAKAARVQTLDLSTMMSS